MEKFPPQENDKEKDDFLLRYPLPEEFKDKLGTAMELKKIISSLIEKDLPENDFKNFKELSEFAKKLKIKYKDAGEYYLYHLMIGSSLNKERMPTKFDFQGEDSIEFFLKSKNI